MLQLLSLLNFIFCDMWNEAVDYLPTKKGQLCHVCVKTTLFWFSFHIKQNIQRKRNIQIKKRLNWLRGDSDVFQTRMFLIRKVMHLLWTLNIENIWKHVENSLLLLLLSILNSLIWFFKSIPPSLPVQLLEQKIPSLGGNKDVCSNFNYNILVTIAISLTAEFKTSECFSFTGVYQAFA